MSEKLDWSGTDMPLSDDIDWGGQAFPTEGGDNSGLYPDPGMSLRDYFAIHAIGMGFDWVNVHETGGYDEAAQVAYQVADAMIRARKVST